MYEKEINKKMNNKHTYNCMICGEELVYYQEYKEVKCTYCSEDFSSNVTCKEGHYVCDTCHSMGGLELIENYCSNTEKTNPMEMAIELMKSSVINMHGPEHHYLVPAVLLTSYYNIKGDKKTKVKKLAVAKARAKDVPGGMCGFHGNCGAAVGTGIFMSIITEATPLSKDNWGLANMMTGTALISIGKKGGPRCCKRDSFIAIEEAARFTEENLDIKLYEYEDYKPKCTFKSKNKECQVSKCQYC